ncbi:MAG: sulfatase-like hydrolase/transferase [Polyangia bacterium]
MLKRLVWGALLGLAAGVLIGGLDVVASAPAVAEQLDTLEARQRFALQLLAIPALGGGLWGALQALLDGALVALLRRLGPREAARQERLRAALWALFAAPPCGFVVWQLLQGPRAQRLPGRPLIFVAVWLLALLGLAAAIRLAAGVGRRLRAEPPGRRRTLGALVCGGLGVAATIGLYLVDRRVLPRLYPVFHLGLQAAQLLGALTALGWLSAAAPDPQRPRRRDTVLLLAAALVGLYTSGKLAQRLVRAQVLRGLALEHTGPSATLLRGYLALFGSGPRARPAAPLLDPAATGSSGPGEEPSAAPPPYSGPRLDGRDVFLLTVDALRYDRLAAATMPFVAGLVPRAVVFERAYTQVPHTSFAVATLLTGKPVYALLTLGQDAASHETLPLILRRFRYKTAAFYPPSVFFVERERLKALEESAYGFEYVKFEYLSGPRRTDQILHFLDEEKPEHVFVWAHYLEPHEPYDVHPGGPGPAASDRERYDGEVRAVDDELRRLYTEVQRRRPGALFVIAADHGEEFGEHGGRYHGTSLYDEQARVPLLLFDAAERPLLRPRRLQRPVGLVDVAPTLLGLLDMEPPVRMRGRDLSPWLLSEPAASEPPPVPVYSEIGRRKMVVLGPRKLLCDFTTDACQLFDLERDPGEKRNLIDAEPEAAARLRGHLDRFIAEAQRYERATPAGAGSGADELRLREALSRARMGDRAVLPRLVTALDEPGPGEAQRAEVLALLGRLVGTTVPAAPGGPGGPGGPGVIDPLGPLLRNQPDGGAAALRRLHELAAPGTGAASGERVGAGWARVALLRLSPSVEPGLLAAVGALCGDESAPGEQRLAAALSLLASCAGPAGRLRGDGIDCVALALKALPAAMALDDPDEVRPLLLLLGQSGDARVVPALLPQLEVVRARRDVVSALGQLGRPEATPELARLLAEDPYVPVRAAAATALGHIGGAAARAALLRAQAREREAPVLAAITQALASP